METDFIQHRFDFFPAPDRLNRVRHTSPRAQAAEVGAELLTQRAPELRRRPVERTRDLAQVERLMVRDETPNRPLRTVEQERL